MNRSPWSRLILGIIFFSMVPLIEAADSPRTGAGEPWPNLLIHEPANIDPSVAALQQRANASLEKLVQLASLHE